MKNYDNFDEIVDIPLADHISIFEADATLPEVPLGLALCRFSNLLQAIDYHMCMKKDNQISYEEAREKIKWASELMDKKFDIPYLRLPQ